MISLSFICFQTLIIYCLPSKWHLIISHHLLFEVNQGAVEKFVVLFATYNLQQLHPIRTVQQETNQDRPEGRNSARTDVLKCNSWWDPTYAELNAHLCTYRGSHSASRHTAKNKRKVSLHLHLTFPGNVTRWWRRWEATDKWGCEKEP